MHRQFLYALSHVSGMKCINLPHSTVHVHIMILKPYILDRATGSLSLHALQDDGRATGSLPAHTHTLTHAANAHMHACMHNIRQII